MTDIFKAIADQSARTILESVAENPGLSAAKITAATELKSEAVEKHLVALVAAGLLKTAGSGASKKYSVNTKGFAPYVSYLAKVAEKQAVSALENQLNEFGEKLGEVIATGTEWINNQANSRNIKIDPEGWAKELGRVLAEAKVEIQKEAKQVSTEAKKLAKGLKTKATNTKK